MFDVLLPHRRVLEKPGQSDTTPSMDERRQALAEVLASESLRRSEQLRAILQFLCEAAIDGRGAQVTESVIAIDVLNRSSSYNSTDDSSVRSRVYTLRQKLAHYYETENPSASIRIEIPKGSYVPQFVTQDTHHPKKKMMRGTWYFWISGAIVSVALIAYLLASNFSRSQVMSLWGPVISDGKPVLVSIGAEKDLVALEEPKVTNPSTEVQTLPNSAERYRVGTGAARALFRLGGLFSQFHVISQLRLSSLTSPDDLRSSPTVLLGAFNNELTLDTTRNLRYHFSRNGALDEISDSKDPSLHWQRHRNPEGEFTDDYGIAARLMRPESQDAIVVAAGIEQCGTAASMDLLTDHLPELNQRMPRNWKQKNFEVLVSTHVIKGNCGAPEIVRIEVW